MTLLKILVLAVVQGAAELLPVSSSAHVIVAEKLMRLDPTSPEMTLLLVMLHTGTMFAVIFYFWSAWRESFLASKKIFWNSARLIAIATFFTGVVGLFLKSLIEKYLLGNVPHAEIELLFGNLSLISASLAAVGIVIMIAGWSHRRLTVEKNDLDMKGSVWIGVVQGLCLPFRGFSRSGATISTGLLCGIAKSKAEEFSFALAVVLTPPLIVREVIRLLQARHASASIPASAASLFYPGIAGMLLSFIAGILALRWLSSWLERGRWHYFGIYCLCFSLVVFLFSKAGL